MIRFGSFETTHVETKRYFHYRPGRYIWHFLYRWLRHVSKCGILFVSCQAKHVEMNDSLSIALVDTYDILSIAYLDMFRNSEYFLNRPERYISKWTIHCASSDTTHIKIIDSFCIAPIYIWNSNYRVWRYVSSSAIRKVSGKLIV